MKKKTEFKAFLITAKHMAIAAILGMILEDLTGLEDMQLAIFTLYPVLFLIYLQRKGK